MNNANGDDDKKLLKQYPSKTNATKTILQTEMKKKKLKLKRTKEE